MSIAAAAAIMRDEIITDPLGRGYSGMTDQQVADDLNTTYRSRNKTTMTGREVKAEVVESEYNVLTADEKNQFISLTSSDNLDPFGIDASIIQNIFGGGSATLLALQAARVESISRADELGYPRVVTLEEVSVWRL